MPTQHLLPFFGISFCMMYTILGVTALDHHRSSDFIQSKKYPGPHGPGPGHRLDLLLFDFLCSDALAVRAESAGHNCVRRTLSQIHCQDIWSNKEDHRSCWAFRPSTTNSHNDDGDHEQSSGVESCPNPESSDAGRTQSPTTSRPF